MSHKQYDQVANHSEDADVASGTRAGLQRIKKSFKTAHRDEESEQHAGLILGVSNAIRDAPVE